MPGWKEVKCLKTNNTEGCGLCNATWGEYWRDIDGESMLFCCDVCADIFQTMVNKVKENTGWNSIDSVNLVGNYNKGRECSAKNGNEEFKYYFRTYSNGKFITFEKR